MALYFYFNETTGDLVYSDQATYGVGGYESLGQQLYTKPSSPSHWIFNSKRADIKTVTKDPNVSGQINILSDIAGQSNVLTSMSNMFSNCRALTSADLSGFDTSSVTDMSRMFYFCSDLSFLDLSGFDTSRVTDMNAMFYFCVDLRSLDLSGFDTSSVTDMSRMFSSCSTLISLDLSSFDTSNATNVDNMFDSCSALDVIDISPNMSNVLSELPSVTYYDVVTRQSYAKADIPGGSTYVRYITDLDRVATMVQTRMGINVAKHLAHRALNKAGSIDIGGSRVDVVRTGQHRASYDRDTLELVTDDTGKVTEMWLVTAG